MTRLQNIMDSLEPAVMGKVEAVIAKHEQQAKSDSDSQELLNAFNKMLLARLERIDKTSWRNRARARRLLTRPINQGVVCRAKKMPFMSLGLMG